LKNVGEAASARQKWPKKRSLHGVNEHFEAIFNAAMATQVVFQQPVKRLQGLATTNASMRSICSQLSGSAEMQNLLCENSAIAKIAVEPVSLPMN